MNRLRCLITVLAIGLAVPEPGLAARPRDRAEFNRVNSRLHGQLLDFTRNHGADRRIWSPALHEKRDLYVYLPPGFDPNQQYPLILCLHGYTQDETYFLKEQVEMLDNAIACGQLPPAIIVAPDGSERGRTSLLKSSTMYANTRLGNYEDYLLEDVWNFVVETFPIRPEPEAHALVGVSLGGGAAFRIAIEHRDRFKIVIGFLPAVNLRYVDCHHRYRKDFDPCCWGWRTKTRPYEVIGQFFGGIVKIPSVALMDSMIPKRGQAAIEELIRLNPIELIDATCLQEGELAMYIAYGRRDQFNIDAQVESFLYLARQRGLTIGVSYDPKGRHNTKTGKKMFPDVVEWLAPLLAPYSPPQELPPHFEIDRSETLVLPSAHRVAP